MTHSRSSAGIQVHRGAQTIVEPEISVIVMAINSDPRVMDAVKSLLSGGVPTEIVVVNTGVGSLVGMLGELLEQVVLVESSRLRLPGGTRNLGITQATAPVVAFLAADCLASPGWAALRLAAHADAPTVASAICPAPDASGRVTPASWAMFSLQHSRRAPNFPPAGAKRYGVSYTRETLWRLGSFREDLRIGEDTEYNDRLARADKPVWRPDLITLHRYPLTFGAAQADAFHRGINAYQWMQINSRRPIVHATRRTVGSVLNAAALLYHSSGAMRWALVGAAPLTVWLVMTYAAGAVAAAAGWRGRPEQRLGR